MPILSAETKEFVHIQQVFALFTFRLGQVLLYYGKDMKSSSLHIKLSALSWVKRGVFSLWPYTGKSVGYFFGDVSC
jgi:hypothetical protein